MEGGDDEDEIFQICQKLVPPLLLSSPGRWRLVEDEESLTNNQEGRTAQERVSYNAKLAVDWIEDEVPNVLEALLRAIRHRSKDAFSLQSRCLIAITASRFISNRKQSRHGFSINEWTNEERLLFTSKRNEELATEILSLQVLRSSIVQEEDRFSLSPEVVDMILLSYIRPLFSMTNSASINVESGRAKQDSKVRKAGGGPLEDETIWKGGDIKRANGMRLLGQNVVSIHQTDPTPIRARHAGIASESIFYICCSSIKAMSNEENAWEQYWTQILPPLLQLLEDPSPRFRLIGTQILNKCLFAGHKDPKRRQKIGTLLLRTGVAQLILSNLASSLTFISNRISGALLQSTSEAWIKLTNVMTRDIINISDNTQSYIQDDGGRGRYEQLSQLIDEGVLRVWAYAPSQSISLDENEPLLYSEDALPEQEEFECMDIIDASINTVINLARNDALGIGIIRYLDVIFEFLIQQLLGMEDKVERAKQKRIQRQGKDPLNITLQRETLSAKAIHDILDISRSCPVIENWCTRCITVCARCWVILAEQRIASQEIQSTLQNIVTIFVETFPQSSKEVLQAIESLNPKQFKPFVELQIT